MIVLALFLLIGVLTLCNSLLVPKFPNTNSKYMVDLRSDTVTQPSQSMRDAMATAEVGDDVFGEDPTINYLETRVADLFGKESSLFFPTGTMANLAATMSWCGTRGSEVILGDKSHIVLFEQGGISQIAGVCPRTVANKQDGTLSIDAVEAAIRTDNIHFPVTELIALENTHNFCGGRILPDGYTEALSYMAHKNNIPVHLDGARIWHAATATNTPVSMLSQHVDSITACLSKGLGAPAGSLLIGPKNMIKKARRIRKALGGGMRQAGILAAAGLKALDDYETGILLPSHMKAKLLANRLSDVPGLHVETDIVDTNIVLLTIELENIDAIAYSRLLKDKGVLVLPYGNKTLRMVTHRDITDEDIKTVITLVREVAARAWTDANSLTITVEATEPIAKVQPPILENPKEEEPKKSNKSEEKSKNNNKNSKTEEVNNIEDTHYEEVMIHGMSVSENGFCVLLKGLISDRLIKIPVTPADPMSDGLDRVEVDSSEAVTLLQLLQGIDVESFLPADALANKFNSVAISDSKHIYSLKRVIIDNVTTAEKGFKSKLCGASSRSEEVTVNVSSNSITANGAISREVVSSSVVETPKKSLQNTETEYLSDTIDVTKPTQGTVLESDVSSTPNPTIDVKEPKRNDYSNPELASSPVINRMDNNLDSVLPLDGTNLYTTEIPIDVEGTETAVEADSLNNYPTMSGVTGVSSTVKSVDNSSKEVNTASVVIDPVNRITATTVTDPNSGEVISTVGNGSNGSLIRTTRSAVEVEVASAFEAIALALRHRAVIEVRSELLSDDNLSYTMDELKAYFPKLLEASRASDITETISTNSDINDRLFEIERLQRRLAEATRQQKEIKIEEIKRQLQWVNNTMSGYDNVLMATAQAAAEAASLMSSIASGISFTNPETK